MLIRRHQPIPVAGGQILGALLARQRTISGKDHLSASSLGSEALLWRRTRRHDNPRRHAQHRRGKDYRLSMIPCGVGHHPGALGWCVYRPDGVVGATKLKGATALEVLCFNTNI